MACTVALSFRNHFYRHSAIYRQALNSLMKAFNGNFRIVTDKSKLIIRYFGNRKKGKKSEHPHLNKDHIDLLNCYGCYLIFKRTG